MSAHKVEKSTEKVFTLEEVAAHKTKDSKFIIIDDKVYDVTAFIDEVIKSNVCWFSCQHPGGVEVVTEFEGNPLRLASQY